MTGICAVIVTYHPSEALIDVVAAASPQVDEILIVDNSLKNDSQEIFQEVTKNNKVTLVRNYQNLGIASALNRGVHWALAKKYSWILTLDQDSIIDSQMVQIMMDSYNAAPERENIGILAPVHYDRNTGYKSKYLRKLKGPYTHKDIVMTSGNLIPAKTFEKVGFYDDDLFIEYVDHDFCLKVKKAGFKTCLVSKAKMAHQLGSIRKHRLLATSFFSHNYLPVRRYYRARNRLILYRRHFHLGWILQDQEFAIKDMIKILLVEDLKWQKVKSTILGTIDGLLGRMGSFDGSTYLTPKASKYFIEFREEIYPLLLETSERVLDLGCGSGETSYHLKQMGKFKWICGVEGSPDVARIAKMRLDQVLEGDIEKMDFPFPDEHFDTILALDILEHLVDPWTVVQKLTKMLKPGGVIVASIPNVRHYSVVFPILFLGDWRYQQEGLLDSTHIRFFTKKTAIQLMTSAGLKLQAHDYTGAKKGLSYIVNKLTLGIFEPFFIFQNLIRVGKELEKSDSLEFKALRRLEKQQGFQSRMNAQVDFKKTEAP